MNDQVSFIISASSVPKEPASIMLVDDDRMMLMMLTQALEQQGHKVTSFRSGDEALQVLKNQPIDVDTIILDREMPGLSGLDVVAELKRDDNLSAVPIIMLTGSGQPEQIKQGIDAGVFYYLVKPASDSMLKSVVAAALRDRRQRKLVKGQMNRREAALKNMESCNLQIKTLADAEDAACFLAYCFPKPERVVTGLLELLINAIEHGNLGITYDEKAQLIANNAWRKEVERRGKLSENADKQVIITYQRKADAYYVQITDQGIGFDWKKFWQIDPSRATAPHGRGIARARLMAFDRIYYNEAGNQVTAAVSRVPEDAIEW